MSQNYTVLLDLDGTLVDTAPDLMMAHNHVMKKFGYESKTTEEIRNLVGKGAGVLIGRSIWGSAKKEFNKISGSIKQGSLTIIPLSLYFSEKGLAKLSCGIAKGKKKTDKRESI